LSNNESSNVFNRSRNQLKTERFNGVNQEINKRNFYLKNNTSYRFANDAGIERVLINTTLNQNTYSNFNFNWSNKTNVQYNKIKEELRVTPQFLKP
jgi:hypothetical protein